MYYGFRIRPLVRLFLAALMFWMAYVCLYTVRHEPMPMSFATLFVITSILFLLGALLVLRGLFHMFRAYGRTWID
jgi:hypothetical protein